MTNKFESKCLQKLVNGKKNGTGRRRLTSSNRAAIFVSTNNAKNDTTNPFGYKLGKSTENNKALLFFSGKETIQTFNPFKLLRCCLRSDKLTISMFENSAKIFF